MSTCSSCGAEILWAVTEKGRRIPLDVAVIDPPHPGLMVFTPGSSPAVAVALGKERTLHVSHFATCPNAEQHRKT